MISLMIDRWFMHSIIQRMVFTALAFNSIVASANVLDLGVAGRFNVFVFNDFISSYSDVEGAVAVGGDFSATGYAVNQLNQAVAGNAMVVGGDLNFQNGSVVNGNIDVAGTINTNPSFTFGGAYTHSQPINFANERIYLQNVSTSLNALSNTGSASYHYSGLQLTASNSSDAQIFDIDGSLFNTRNNTTFTGFSAGQTIILNISGSNLTFNGGTGTNFANGNFNVIYNFYEATAISTGSGATGTILAPLANITGGFTAINGNVIANSWNTNTQVNVRGMYRPTEISGLVVTPVPEPASFALMLSGLGMLAISLRRRQLSA